MIFCFDFSIRLALKQSSLIQVGNESYPLCEVDLMSTVVQVRLPGTTVSDELNFNSLVLCLPKLVSLIMLVIVHQACTASSVHGPKRSKLGKEVSYLEIGAKSLKLQRPHILHTLVLVSW